MNLHNMLTIAKLTLKGIWNNKFAFCIVVFTPVLICINFGYVAYKSPVGIKMIILEDKGEHLFLEDETRQFIDLIENYTSVDGSKPFTISVMPGTAGRASQLLDSGLARGVLKFSTGNNDVKEINVLIDATEPVLISHFERELLLIIEEYSSILSAKKLTDLEDLLTVVDSTPVSETAAGGGLVPYELIINTYSTGNLIFFDFFASAVIVLVALSLPLALSSLSITLDRNLGVLERIFATPYKKSEIVIGKMTANSFLSLVITIMIIITLKVFFNITLGNIGVILMLAILIAVNGVILGLFLSAVTSKETQSLLASMIALLLFMSTMTFLWPLETMHPLMQSLSRFTPYIYGVQAVRNVNLIGAGLNEVWLNILFLILFIAIQALITIQLFRRRIA
jgi:ABC-type multidrug transport system permease subunit